MGHWWRVATIEIDPHTMTTGDVARVMGLSVTRVQQLDGELRPTRSASGQRRYAPADVEALAIRRAARR